MKIKQITIMFTLLLLFCLSCVDDISSRKKTHITKENYKEVIGNSTAKIEKSLPSDSSNIFDLDTYDPSADTVEEYLNKINSSFEEDSIKIKEIGTIDTTLLTTNNLAETEDTIIKNATITDTFSKELKDVNTEEIKALKFNLAQKNNDTTISIISKQGKQIESKLWAKISKKDQRLYLFLDGEPIDTFKVSTGDKKHETPTFDTRPSGRMYKKYTSKKFPGGNYNGLGNMPYVVFIKGGYAIHGTTTGNIPKLGRKASHGCIRLHPAKAKIFFELINNIGPENSWITVSEN